MSPGNANLLIGVERGGMLPKGVTGEVQKGANLEIGVPGVPAWHSRGYLPHFEVRGAIQHVTFHLADSLPQMMLRRLEAELKTLPIEKRDVERRKRVDAWIDAGHGACVTRQPGIADMAQDSLLTFDYVRYRLLAWVVMPNHVHVLFGPIEGWTVAKIVAGWKKFTARKIRDERRDDGQGSGGPVWHREYWDRYIRDERHFRQAVEYIHLNPVKAGLVGRAEMWRWSSASANREIGVPG